MIMLPIAASLWIKNSNNMNFRIWLPIFLIWPFVISLILVLVPVILLISLILWPSGKGRPLLLAAPIMLYVLGNLRGFMIDISGAKEKIFIKIE